MQIKFDEIMKHWIISKTCPGWNFFQSEVYFLSIFSAAFGKIFKIPLHTHHKGKPFFKQTFTVYFNIMAPFHLKYNFLSVRTGIVLPPGRNFASLWNHRTTGKKILKFYKYCTKKEKWSLTLKTVPIRQDSLFVTRKKSLSDRIIQSLFSKVVLSIRWRNSVWI